MYKCSDCGEEFQIKPEYCNCGNNIFEEINEQISEQPQLQESQTIQETPAIKNILATNSPTPKKTNSEISFGALFVFFLCLGLSVLSIMYLGNNLLEKANQPKQEKTHEKKQNNNIPHIDSFWLENNNKQINIEQKTPIQKPIVAKKAENIIKKTTQAKNTQKTTTTQKKQQVTTSQKTTKPQTSKPKPTPATQVQKTTVQQSTTSKQPSQIQQPQQVVAPVVTEAMLKKELLNYKIALRNKLASNIRFENIIGDGSCVVSFKIDTNGNLINRKFVQQSTNTSLNDEVYAGIMKTPSYQNPPAGYKNETILITVKIYAGNFSVNIQ